MSKLLSSVLDRISENNNEYRTILRNLNSSIDEKTTSLVADVVTMSSYTADFSNTLAIAKEKLSNPISRIIESYVIKDLRSVETVNEQFIDKINDKLENEKIESVEEKNAFVENLNHLLNDKYLEIVKIKRTNFIDEEGKNDSIESAVQEFYDYIMSNSKIDEVNLQKLLNDYKNSLYELINKSLVRISDLYLNNFVSEVSSSLNAAIDFEPSSTLSEKHDDFKPFIPEMNPISTNDVTPTAISEISEDDLERNVQKPFISLKDIPNIPEVSDDAIDNDLTVEIPKVELPQIPQIPNDDSEVLKEIPEIKPSNQAVSSLGEDKEDDAHKRPYDVEEILKIAKSPIISMPKEESHNEEVKTPYVSVTPITEEKETETMESEFNEKEIVEEMIRRLTNRLNDINERTSKYESEKEKLEEDEAFVNDLIKSSNEKKEELDRFESELDEKEKELDERQKELDKKINDVMPFANAVLKSEE